MPDALSIDALAAFVERHAPLFVLTGAGCSAGSGIPDYRDHDGAWKRPAPTSLQSFLGSEQARKRYWARSMLGWPRLQAARPNPAHRALAQLELDGAVRELVTQNVDGLHQAAGSAAVIDLHGRIDGVRCLRCGAVQPRAALQAELLRRNPRWAERPAVTAPDGDAALEEQDYSHFELPGCRDCGGVLKPDVVFFGECVPASRVQQAMAQLHASRAMLVVGSSLMVLSGYRFARAAAEAGKPIAAVNLGRTRADELLTLKLRAPCAETLCLLLQRRGNGATHALEGTQEGLS